MTTVGSTYDLLLPTIYPDFQRHLLDVPATVTDQADRYRLALRRTALAHVNDVLVSWLWADRIALAAAREIVHRAGLNISAGASPDLLIRAVTCQMPELLSEIKTKVCEQMRSYLMVLHREIVRAAQAAGRGQPTTRRLRVA